MTKTKTPPRCTTTGTAKKQSIAKSSITYPRRRQAGNHRRFGSAAGRARLSRYPHHHHRPAGAESVVRAVF